MCYTIKISALYLSANMIIRSAYMKISLLYLVRSTRENWSGRVHNLLRCDTLIWQGNPYRAGLQRCKFVPPA